MFYPATRRRSESSLGKPIRRNAFAACHDSKGADLINTVRRATDWLVESLIEAWTTVEDRLWPRRRLLLVRTADGYALQYPEGQTVMAGLPLTGELGAIPA